jgi:hypothetical protein
VTDYWDGEFKVHVQYSPESHLPWMVEVSDSEMRSVAQAKDAATAFRLVPDFIASAWRVAQDKRNGAA